MQSFVQNDAWASFLPFSEKKLSLTNKEFVADVTETEKAPINNQEKDADDTVETEKSIDIEVPENDKGIIEEEEMKEMKETKTFHWTSTSQWYIIKNECQREEVIFFLYYNNFYDAK